MSFRSEWDVGRSGFPRLVEYGLRRMNVLILNDVGFDLKGGTEAYCEMLSRVNLMLGNNVVKACLNKGEGADTEVAYLSGSDTPVARAFFDRRLAHELNKLCEASEIDLIHANVLNFRYLPTLLKSSAPLILTTHTWVYRCPIEYKVMLPELKPCRVPSPNGHCLLCMISRRNVTSETMRGMVPRIMRMSYNAHVSTMTLKRASSVISPSRVFSRELRKQLNVKAHYIPNPVEQKLIETRPTDGGDGSLVFLGRLEWEKGVRWLPTLAEILSHLQIHIGGEGRLKNWLLRNMRRNMTYHGLLSGKDKDRVLRECSVVIVPSIGHEMFPGTIAEAFGYGKPVVAFDLGGPKEQIEESKGGLLATPFEIDDFACEVEYLHTNPTEAMRMGQTGRKWVEENLNPEMYAKALQRVYNETMCMT